jgi:hypothetical protein
MTLIPASRSAASSASATSRAEAIEGIRDVSFAAGICDGRSTVRFNLIKFRTDELKLSFLSYPDFFNDPHPALRKAITIDLVKGKSRHTDYAENINPPILHRKETFLPAGRECHSRNCTVASGTRCGEFVRPSRLKCCFPTARRKSFAEKGRRNRLT